MDTLPLYSEDLIGELDKQFRAIRPEDVMAKPQNLLAFQAGQRHVVDVLQMVLARTKEEDLDLDV